MMGVPIFEVIYIIISFIQMYLFHQQSKCNKYNKLSSVNTRVFFKSIKYKRKTRHDIYLNINQFQF